MYRNALFRPDMLKDVLIKIRNLIINGYQGAFFLKRIGEQESSAAALDSDLKHPYWLYFGQHTDEFGNLLRYLIYPEWVLLQNHLDIGVQGTVYQSTTIPSRLLINPLIIL